MLADLAFEINHFYEQPKVSSSWYTRMRKNIVHVCLVFLEHSNFSIYLSTSVCSRFTFLVLVHRFECTFDDF